MLFGVDAFGNWYYFFPHFWFIYVFTDSSKKNSTTCAPHLCRIRLLLGSQLCHLYGGNWICISFSLALRGKNNHAGVITGPWCRVGIYFIGYQLQNPCCCISAAAAVWTAPIKASEGLTTGCTIEVHLKSLNGLRGFWYASCWEMLFIVHMSRMGLSGAWMSWVKSQRAKTSGSLKASGSFAVNLNKASFSPLIL